MKRIVAYIKSLFPMSYAQARREFNARRVIQDLNYRVSREKGFDNLATSGKLTV